MATRYLITGATGFVGSHVVDRALAEGGTVVVLVREGSDLQHLEKLGVTIVRGDLNDAAAIRQAMQDVQMVIHCAAKVGDWGPADDYRKVNVEGLRLLLDAARQQPIQRFVHLSSLGVYEARHHFGTDENEPIPDTHMDGYTQSKVEAEKLALQYHRDYQLPVTVLRPGFIYGPRDRTLLPTVVANMKRGVIRYIGGGRAALNTTYVGNLVDAIFLACQQPNAIGQVFNITDGEHISKRRFFETIADGLGLKRPSLSVPLWLAKFMANIVEKRARKKGWPTAPRLTQGRIKFLGLNLDFSIAKARTQLGYSPKVGFDEGMKATLDWYRANMESATK